MVDKLTLLWSALVLFLVYLILKINRKLSYFKSRRIPYMKPYFAFGSLPKLLALQEYWGISWGKAYKELAGNKLGGVYVGTMPYILIRDPEYINNIFTSDFSSFYDRSFTVDENTNPLDGHLFFLRGNKWRILRNKLSPIFTSGKLKWMYDVMYECGNLLLEQLDEIADGRDIVMKEQLARFTTDVIGSCAFGIEAEGLKNPESQFRAMGKKFFAPTFKQAFIFVVRFVASDLAMKLKMKTIDNDVNEFFTSAFKNVLDYRAKSGVVRKDFVQLLLQLKKNGQVEADSSQLSNGFNFETANEIENEKFEITDPLLAAQSFVFFVAGFETTASTLHITLYYLSTCIEAQNKAREEILKAKRKHGGLTYDALKELKYLDNCINESLRLCPPVPNLNRECTKDYTFPDGTFIEKGTKITIPIMALHRDPQYFPDPLSYRPERFEQPPQRGTFLPFGDGPRICIGKRFALIEMKMILSRLLEVYSFEPSPLSKSPLEPIPTSIVYFPKHELFVRMKRLKI